MAIKHVKGDFFDGEHSADHRAFGFTGSAKPARNHPMDPGGEDDASTYVEKMRHGGRIKRDGGGSVGEMGPYVPPQYDPNWQKVYDPNGTLSAELDKLSKYNPTGAPAGMRKGGAVGHKPSTAKPANPRGYQMGGMVDGTPTARPAMMQPGANPAGSLANATISMPANDATQLMARVATAGKLAGARQAVNAMANQARMRRGMPMPAQAGALNAGSPPAPAHQGIPMRHGGAMTAAKRHNLPSSDFALPGERYPINDASHARNALARVSGNGTPSEKARVRAAVHRKYPDIGKK